MATYWEHLAGDTSRFAVRLALQHDPHRGAAATSEESASWGAFQIWVENQNVCAHTEGGETLDYVHWYLVHVLEWVADNWDPLLHEERLPVKNVGADSASSLRLTRFPPERVTEPEASAWFEEWQDWWTRHSIQAARDGGLFPDLLIRRSRDTIEVAWARTELAGVTKQAGVEFLVPAGSTRFRPEEVAMPLHAVTLAAATELASRYPGSERFGRLVERLGSLRTRERHEQRAAWMAGLGRSAETVVQSWQALRERLEPLPGLVRAAVLGSQENDLVVTAAPAAALLFGAVSPTVNPEDVDVLVHLLADAATDVGEPASVSEVARDEPLDERLGRTAAEHGQELATELLHHLGVDTEKPVDVEGLLERLGIVERDIELTDAKIRGVSIAGSNFEPTIALNRSYPWSERPEVSRFTRAHELCHILFDRGYRKRVAVASGPWAPRDVERRANAFAASLLMPAELLELAIGNLQHPLLSREGLLELSGVLGTSASATLEHLYNVDMIDAQEREELRAVAHWRPMQ